MALTERDLQTIEGLFASVVGTAVTEARLSDWGGSWISVRLGKALIRVDMVAWRMESDAELLLACEDRREHIRGLISELDGRSLTRVQVSRHLDLVLDFDGVRLILFVSGSAAVDVQHWSIQLPTGETLFAGPGVRWWVAGGASG